MLRTARNVKSVKKCKYLGSTTNTISTFGFMIKILDVLEQSLLLFKIIKSLLLRKIFKMVSNFQNSILKLRYSIITDQVNKSKDFVFEYSVE